MTLNDTTVLRFADQLNMTPDEVREMIASLDAGTSFGLDRPRHFDRQGNPMTFGEWAVAFRVERVVKQTQLDNGILISTVWLGLDHSFGGGAPLIFETMVAVPTTLEMYGRTVDGLDDLEMERFHTETQACRAHDELVAKWADIGVDVVEVDDDDAGKKQNP